jgi:hypothetical protein
MCETIPITYGSFRIFPDNLAPQKWIAFNRTSLQSDVSSSNHGDIIFDFVERAIRIQPYGRRLSQNRHEKPAGSLCLASFFA